MTKSEEIAVLKSAAKKLGTDSYLGPALASLIPYLEMELRSDICPDLLGLVRDMEGRVAEMTKESNGLSNQMLAKADLIKQLDAQIATRQSTLQEVQFDIERANDRAREALLTLKSYL